MNDLLVARDQVRYEQKVVLAEPDGGCVHLHVPGGLSAGGGDLGRHSKIPDSTLRYSQYLVVAMLVFGVIAASYTNLGITLSIRRDSGVLKRMRGTPIAIVSYVGGIIGSVIINVVFLTALVVAIGMVGYHLHFPYHPAAMVLTLLVGVVCFSALGLAVTVMVPNAEAAPAMINGIYFPIVFISGVFYPISNGSVLSRIATYFPVRHMVNGLVGAFENGPSGSAGPRPAGDAGLGGHRPALRRPPVPLGAATPLSRCRYRTGTLSV